MARVLIAEDDEHVRQAVAFLLRREGHEVVEAVDGDEALSLAAAVAPDLVLLDVMMPKVHGFEVLRRLRTRSAVPVLMLTARMADADIVTGLDAGADDYVTKPFGTRELVARVKALLRRGQSAGVQLKGAIAVGGLRLDAAGRTAEIEGRTVRLTPTEFELLTLMASRPGRSFSASALVKGVHGYDAAQREAMAVIRVTVNRLRRKIEPDPANPVYLRTVRGGGYMLGAPAAADDDAGEAARAL